MLALNYDGTLAPLDSEPERAAMRLSTRRLLTRASRLYPCVTISGRARTDAESQLRGVEVAGVVGNRGAEPSPDRETIRQRLEERLPVIKRRLSGTLETRSSLSPFTIGALVKKSPAVAIFDAGRWLNDVRILVGSSLSIALCIRN